MIIVKQIVGMRYDYTNVYILFCSEDGEYISALERLQDKIDSAKRSDRFVNDTILKVWNSEQRTPLPIDYAIEFSRSLTNQDEINIWRRSRMSEFFSGDLGSDTYDDRFSYYEFDKVETL